MYMCAPSVFCVGRLFIVATVVLRFLLTSLMLLTDRIKQQWGVDTNVLSFDTIWMRSFYSFEPLLWVMYVFVWSKLHLFFPPPLPLFFSIAGHCFLFFFYLNIQQTQKKEKQPDNRHNADYLHLSYSLSDKLCKNTENKQRLQTIYWFVLAWSHHPFVQPSTQFIVRFLQYKHSNWTAKQYDNWVNRAGYVQMIER